MAGETPAIPVVRTALTAGGTLAIQVRDILVFSNHFNNYGSRGARAGRSLMLVVFSNNDE
jgi:hypothetical protein